MLHFVESEIRRNGNIITVNMDGYTDRKTVLGAVHEIGKEVAKYDENEGSVLINVKTASEVKECFVQNTSADTYCFELEEVSCSSKWNEETEEMEYEEGTYYFHIRFFIYEEVFPELKEKVFAEKYEATKKGHVERIETVKKNTETIESISIFVNWKRSRVWGYNPAVTAYVDTKTRRNTFNGSASGCGYDKESAAVAEALNQSNALLKVLYTVKEKALSEGWKPENTSESNASCIHYGAGYGSLPYFESGVGMSSLEGVLNKCGFRMKHQNHTKYNDYYYFETV